MERTDVITFKGAPMTLVGPDLRAGEQAPEFQTVTTDLSPVTLATDAGKTRLIIAVPSVDTSVCSLETKKFSGRAAELGDDVAVYVVSADLPFAQKRFCGSEGIENLKMISDHRDLSFARSYGILIKELKLLARSVWVIDGADRITYREIVREVANEPDYDAAIEAAQKAG